MDRFPETQVNYKYYVQAPVPLQQLYGSSDITVQVMLGAFPFSLRPAPKSYRPGVGSFLSNRKPSIAIGVIR